MIEADTHRACHQAACPITERKKNWWNKCFRGCDHNMHNAQGWAAGQQALSVQASGGDEDISKGRELHKSGHHKRLMAPRASGLCNGVVRARLEEAVSRRKLALRPMPRWGVQTAALSRAVKRVGFPFGYKHVSLQICGNSGCIPSPALLPDFPSALHAFHSREQKEWAAFLCIPNSLAWAITDQSPQRAENPRAIAMGTQPICFLYIFFSFSILVACDKETLKILTWD